MRLRHLVSLMLFALVPPSAATRVFGGEAAEALLRLAPPDAGMTLIVEDLRGHARQFFESPLGAGLSQLPAVREWRASENAQGLQQAKRQIEKVVGENVATLRDDLLGDAVVLVLHVAPGEAPDQAHGLLLTRVRNRPLLDRVIQEFNSAQTRKGEITRVVTKEWQGAPYSARVFRDPQRPTEFYATLDQTFAWSNSEKLLQGALERRSGGKASLADAPKFRGVREKLPVSAAVSLFLDGGFLRRVLSNAPPQKKSAAEERAGALFGRYVGALEYAGASLDWREGIVLQTEEMLDPSRLDPWIKAWAARREKVAPEQLRVPETALGMTSLYVDFPALLQAAESLVSEDQHTKLANSLEAIKGVLLGRDLRTEILPHLGPAVLAYFEAPQKGDSAPGVPLVLSVAVGGEPQVGAALENGLRTLLAVVALDEKQAKAGLTVQKREISGVEVTSLHPSFPFAFAVRGGRVVLGRSPEAVARAFGKETNRTLTALRAEHFPDRSSFACVDLVALESAAEAHRAALVKRLASRNQRSEETQARDLEQVLALIKLFRAAYVTSAMAPEATSVHRVVGLIARDPKP